MPRAAVQIQTGISADPDPVAAFEQATAAAATGLTGACDLAVVFVSGTHLTAAEELLQTVGSRLRPRTLIGCGAGGVLAGGQELETGAGVAVWALSAPRAEIHTRHLTDPAAGVDEPAEAVILLADPHSFPVEALLDRLETERPALPVLGGLASGSLGGAGLLFHDDHIHSEGAVACSLSGLGVVPCVSQGATPVGPEMTITAAERNVILELASRPALERLRAAVVDLEAPERELAAQGLMLGIVIDENQPEYERGDFLVRPIVAADPERGSLAVGQAVRVGQTVRMHVRDEAGADEDLRAALRLGSAAMGDEGAAGALVFSCNGRGSHMFSLPDHDAAAVDDALGAPAAGFFCAGEIGPVGGRNFLHGFTATIAVFPRGG